MGMRWDGTALIRAGKTGLELVLGWSLLKTNPREASNNGYGFS